MNRNNLSLHRMEELSDIAEYYADNYFRNSTVIVPQDIAAALGLSYSVNDYGNAFDGQLEYSRGSFHIYINNRGNEHIYHPRTRFTFAHELGHYLIEEHRHALLDPTVKPHASFSNFASVNIAELEADFFASSLLMPLSRIKQDIYRKPFNFTLVDEMASKYNVSLTAAVVKFMTLDKHPIMLVCSRDKIIKWFRYSHDFPFRNLLTGKGDSVPEATSAGEYFYEGIKNYKKTEIVFAEDWFQLYSATDRRRGFNEYCIYFEPLNQVISVLWES